MNNLDTALEFYENIRNRVITHGWRRGYSFYKSGRQKSILEIIEIVSDDMKLNSTDTTEYEDFIRYLVANNKPKFVLPEMGSYSVSLIEWNDNSKKKDILDILDQAISAIKSELAAL